MKKMTKRASSEQTAIGPWLLIPVLLVASMSHGMLNNPRFAVQVMGNNAYWAFPFAFIFTLLAMAAIYLLAKRFPGQTIVEQGKSVLGKFFGTMTGLGYMGFYLLFLAMLTRDIINFTSVYFLFRTPLFVLVLFYLLAAAFLASRGIETITRTASLTIIPALLVIFGLMILAYQNINLNNLKPVFTPNLFGYLQAGKVAMQNFYMLGFVAMVLPFLKPLNSFPRAVGGTTFVIFTFMILHAIGAIGVNGPKLILRLAYPSFEFFRVINMPFLLLEQTGMIIGIAWLTMILIGTSFGHYGMALGFSQIVPAWDYKIWVWLLVPVKLIVIMLPPGVLQTKMAGDFIAQNGWIPLFGYPLFLWIVALILKKKGATGYATV